MTHLDRLEAESIFILRELFSQIDPLAMLCSLGAQEITVRGQTLRLSKRDKAQIKRRCEKLEHT